MTGNGAARLIGVAFIPLLTRIYSPEDFGVLAVFSSLVLILAPMLALRFVLALPLPRSNALAINVFFLCLLGISVQIGVMGVLLLLFGDKLLKSFSVLDSVFWLWLLLAGAAASACFELLTLWSTRMRDYRIIAVSQLLQVGLAESSKTILGLLAFKPVGLLLGQVIGHVAGSTSLLLKHFHEIAALKRHVSLSRIWVGFRRYADFPRFRLPAQLLLALSMQSPPLLTAVLFDTATTGQYGLALMALLLPMNLLGYSVGRAYFAEVSHLGVHQVAEIRILTRKVTTLMLAVGLPVALFLFITGPFLFSFLFGERWLLAGQIASALAPYLAFQFIASPITQVFNVVGTQADYLRIYFRQVALTAIPFGAAPYFDADIIAVATFLSVTLSFHYLLIFLRAWRLMSRCSQ